MSVEPDHLLIFGCGFLGLRVAQLWRVSGGTVSAVTRSDEKAEQFAAQGIDPVLNSSPEHCKALVTREVARLIPIVKKLGIAL